MDTSKVDSERGRSPVSLAYETHRDPQWKRKEQAVPGVLFDATILGLFLVLGIGLLF